jgi:hypothetical protein
MTKSIFEFQTLPNISPSSEWGDHEVQMWLNLVNRTVRAISCYNLDITPASVGANSTDDQQFTLEGLTPNMRVFIEPPELAGNLAIAYVRIPTIDTLEIRFLNNSGGALTPASGIYKVTTIRQ